MKTLLILLLVCSTVPFPLAAQALPLFKITKSSNHNEVVYELREAEIHAYWRMLEEDGHVEELTSLERSRVYGTDLQTSLDPGVRFTIRALPAYPITVHAASDATPYATLRLLGEEWRVISIHLELSRGLFGGIRWIEVQARKTASPPVKIILEEDDGRWNERIQPNPWQLGSVR